MRAENGHITPLPAGSDNYMYLVRGTQGHAVAVDPGEAKPIQALCTLLGLRLTHLLLTHHHGDHTGGVAHLVKAYNCEVIGLSKHACAAITRVCTDNAPLDCAGLSLQVLATPGHTTDSCCYYCEEGGNLFTGDTLFLGGCGRLRGGTGEQLYSSLQRLAALPGETSIWCGHEYTLDNLAFARAAFPQNREIEARGERELVQYNESEITVPGTIAEEKATNPFLLADSVESFLRLRKEKDRF